MWIFVIASLIDLIIGGFGLIPNKSGAEFCGYYVDSNSIWASIVYTVEIWIIYIAVLKTVISSIILKISEFKHRRTL